MKVQVVEISIVQGTQNYVFYFEEDNITNITTGKGRLEKRRGDSAQPQEDVLPPAIFTPHIRFVKFDQLYRNKATFTIQNQYH